MKGKSFTRVIASRFSTGVAIRACQVLYFSDIRYMSEICYGQIPTVASLPRNDMTLVRCTFVLPC